MNLGGDNINAAFRGEIYPLGYKLLPNPLCLSNEVHWDMSKSFSLMRFFSALNQIGLGKSFETLVDRLLDDTKDSV